MSTQSLVSVTVLKNEKEDNIVEGSLKAVRKQ